MVVIPGSRQSIETLAFSPDNHWLALGGSNEKAGLRLWNLASQTLFPDQSPESAAVYGLQWHAGRVPKLVVGFRAIGVLVLAFNGLEFLVKRRTDTLLAHAVEHDAIWRTNLYGRRSSDLIESTVQPSGQLRPKWSAPLAGGWGLIARALDGKRCVSAEFHYLNRDLQGANKILVRSRADGNILHEFPLSRKSLDAIAVSPNGKMVAFACRKSIQIWSGTPGYEFLTELANDNRRQYTSIQFAPSGRFLVAASNDGSIQFFDSATWRRERAFDWNIGRVRCLAFSSDGTLIAAGSHSGTAVIWDVEL